MIASTFIVAPLSIYQKQLSLVLMNEDLYDLFELNDDEFVRRVFLF